jgi:hypothetical protein
MTIVTLIATGDMCWVLACGSYAIVTGSASADNLSMVNGHRRHESCGAMAVFADICRLHVNGTLAHGGKPVMTRNTVSDDADMVENSRRPGSDSMAVITLIT